jgi:hypothetical protein
MIQFSRKYSIFLIITNFYYNDIMIGILILSKLCEFRFLHPKASIYVMRKGLHDLTFA